MKSDEQCMDHRYVDMCHSINESLGELGDITTLHADDGLRFLSIIHCESENEESYAIIRIVKTKITVLTNIKASLFRTTPKAFRTTNQVLIPKRDLGHIH